MENRWKMIVPALASEVVGSGCVDPSAIDLLKPEMRPEDYIEELQKAGKWPDAIKILSHSLPVREAVWWACVCARQMKSLAADRAEISALEAAERWALKPTDEQRLTAFNLAQNSPAKSAGTLAALGAALSGGNLPAGEGRFIDLDGPACSQLVVASLVVTASEENGDTTEERFRKILASGQDIALGGNGMIDGQRG